MRVFSSVFVGCVLLVLLGCQPPVNDDVTPYPFVASSRQPHELDASEIGRAARIGLRANETISSLGTFRALGLGHTVVQVVAEGARLASVRRR